MDKKIKPSELETEAQRLIASGGMPSLEKLLQVVAETRGQYRDKILAARKKPNGDE